MLPSSGPLAMWLSLPVAGSMRKLAATIGSPRVAANRNFLSGLIAIGVEPAVLAMPAIATMEPSVVAMFPPGKSRSLPERSIGNAADGQARCQDWANKRKRPGGA